MYCKLHCIDCYYFCFYSTLLTVHCMCYVQGALCSIYTAMHTQPEDLPHIIATILAGMPVPPATLSPHMYTLKNGDRLLVPVKSTGPRHADGTVLLLFELLGKNSTVLTASHSRKTRRGVLSFHVSKSAFICACTKCPSYSSVLSQQSMHCHLSNDF